MTPQPRVAIYLRVSTEEQAEGHSLDAQRKICTHFAEQRGWQIVATYEDAGHSAKSDKRPAFQRMIADVRAGAIEIVLTHKLDRFSRSISDIFRYMREFHERGTAYVSISEQFDFTTPMGKVMLALLAAFAEWYIDNLSAETSKGKKERAMKGLWNGDVPFGYKRIQTGTLSTGRAVYSLQADEHDAPGIRLAFEFYASGQYNDREVAAELNARGYLTANKTGRRPFSKDTVCAMLKNRFFLGEAKYKSDSAVGRHPALVDQETFDKSQAARARHRNRQNKAPITVTRIYKLSTLLFCGECGSRLRGQMQGAAGRHYRDTAPDYDRACSQKRMLKADDVESLTAEVLTAIPLPVLWQQAVLDQLKTESRAGDIERQRAALQSRIRRAEQLFQWGHWDEGHYKTERAELAAQLSALKPIETTDLEKAAELLADFPRLYHSANDEQKKRLFQSMIERAYVRDGQLVALQPTAPFYPLLIASCGLDGHSVSITLKANPRPFSISILTQPLAV